MRFCFTVFADNQTELADALDAVRSALPHNLFETHTKGFMIDVMPDGLPPAGLDPGAVPEAAPAPAEARRRSKATPEPAATQDDPPDASPFDDVPEPAPTLTPAEAKLKALDLLRDAFGRKDGPARVKALQTEYGVGKFMEVPDAKGLELLAKAEALIAKLPG